MQLSKHVLARGYIDTMSKTAAINPEIVQSLKGLGHTAMEVAPIAVPLATMAVQGIGAVISKMTEASRKAQAFKSMMDENPHLARHDATDVQRYFNTLHRLNPELAGDPTVAASFVNNMASLNRPDMPHPALFEQARQLSALRKPDQGSFGKDFSDVVMRMGDAARKGQSEEMKGRMGEMAHDLKVQQRYNSMLKSHAQSLRRRAGATTP